MTRNKMGEQPGKGLSHEVVVLQPKFYLLAADLVDKGYKQEAVYLAIMETAMLIGRQLFGRSGEVGKELFAEHAEESRHWAVHASDEEIEDAVKLIQAQAGLQHLIKKIILRGKHH